MKKKEEKTKGKKENENTMLFSSPFLDTQETRFDRALRDNKSRMLQLHRAEVWWLSYIPQMQGTNPFRLSLLHIDYGVDKKLEKKKKRKWQSREGRGRPDHCRLSFLIG